MKHQRPHLNAGERRKSFLCLGCLSLLLPPNWCCWSKLQPESSSIGFSSTATEHRSTYSRSLLQQRHKTIFWGGTEEGGHRGGARPQCWGVMSPVFRDFKWLTERWCAITLQYTSTTLCLEKVAIQFSEEHVETVQGHKRLPDVFRCLFRWSWPSTFVRSPNVTVSHFTSIRSCDPTVSCDTPLHSFWTAGQWRQQVKRSVR